MTRSAWRVLSLLLVAGLLLLWAACGSNNAASTPGSKTSPATAASTVQVTVGDGPGDRVAALNITINSISLTPASGSAVNVLTAPVTVEMTQLAGTTTPIATLNVPAGTYNQVTIALGGASISFLDATGNLAQKNLPAPPPVTIALSPAFVSDGTPLTLNLDLSLDSSIQFNDAAGTVTFNPRFLASHSPMAGPPPGAPPDPFKGGVEHMLGRVSAVSGATFTITGPMQRTVSFTTNSSTVFVGVSGVSALQQGMLVMVNGQAQSDGSLLALRVVALNATINSSGTVGLVVKTTGSPVTQFQMVGRGMVAAQGTTSSDMFSLPMGLIVNVTSSTIFRYNTDGVDLTGITLPTPSASTLFAGMVVEADTSGGVTAATAGTMMMGSLPLGGTWTATQVEFEQQPVAGTVAGYSGGGTFTLTIPQPSLFANLTGALAVTVYKQPGTVVMNGLNLANGQNVVVRGLLLNDNGSWKLIATRIEQLTMGQ
jgi:hypothetical protein